MFSSWDIIFFHKFFCKVFTSFQLRSFFGWANQGDETQIDLKKGIVSGFSHSIKTLKSIKGIGFVNLDDNDVVRHKLVKKIINAYNK